MYEKVVLNLSELFTILVEKCNSVNLHGSCALRYDSFLTILNFLLIDARVKLVAIDIEFYATSTYTPFNFS